MKAIRDLMPTSTTKIYPEIEKIILSAGINRSAFTLKRLVESGLIRKKERGEGFVWIGGKVTNEMADEYRQCINLDARKYTKVRAAKRIAARKAAAPEVFAPGEPSLDLGTPEPVESKAESKVTVPAGTVFTEELLCDLIKRLQPAPVKTKILEADNVIDALHTYHESIMKLHASHERQMREMDERLSKVTVTLVDLAESNKKLREMIQTLAGLVELQSNAVRYQIRHSGEAHSIA